PLPALERESLTGLVGAVSARRPLPPEVAAGEASPVEVGVKEGDERLRVALVEGVDRDPQPADQLVVHGPSVTAITGLTSRTGVPSTASSGRTRTLAPSTARTSTSWSPIGFGRSEERVVNTPRSGIERSSRGCTRSTSRSARWSHVRTTTRSPGR